MRYEIGMTIPIVRFKVKETTTNQNITVCQLSLIKHNILDMEFKLITCLESHRVYVGNSEFTDGFVFKDDSDNIFHNQYPSGFQACLNNNDYIHNRIITDKDNIIQTGDLYLDLLHYAEMLLCTIHYDKRYHLQTGIGLSALKSEMSHYIDLSKRFTKATGKRLIASREIRLYKSKEVPMNGTFKVQCK